MLIGSGDSFPLVTDKMRVGRSVFNHSSNCELGGGGRSSIRLRVLRKRLSQVQHKNVGVIVFFILGLADLISSFMEEILAESFMDFHRTCHALTPHAFGLHDPQKARRRGEGATSSTDPKRD